VETPAIDLVEFYISRAEIFYRSGQAAHAIREAETALSLCRKPWQEEKRTAIRIFIARAYARDGDFARSNKKYRELISDRIFIPPIVMGLMHNNLRLGADEKVYRNITLMRLFT